MPRTALRVVGAGEDAPRGWWNRLPGWIQADHAARGAAAREARRAKDDLPADARPATAAMMHTLQTIANACDPAQADGTLRACFGGVGLVERCGVHATTFWRHLERLEEVGYVVTLARGGRGGDRLVGNTYAIPGSRGALDVQAVPRERRRVVRGEDGRRRVQIVQPGAQAELWIEPMAESSDAGGLSTTGPPTVAKRDCASSKTRLCYSQNATPPYPSGKPSGTQSGVARAVFPEERARPKISAVTPADLADVGRLIELHGQAVRRGWARDCEYDRDRVVAAAVHAQRVGDDPPRLFASIVRRSRWLLLSDGDLIEAGRRVRAWLAREAD